MVNSINQNFQYTQLTGINIAKASTILLLLGFAFFFGISDLRQVLYLCLHVSYCVWWLLEQWFYPQRSKILFSDPIGIPGLILSVAIIGIFYALPGYLAFINPDTHFPSHGGNCPGFLHFW